MRAGFLLAVLALALGYTALAFTELSWLSSAGRLGPGFFPRLIGVGLVALCLYSLAADRGRTVDAATADWRAAGMVAVLSAAFVALLEVLGGLIAMVAFMAAALYLLNRGRPLQNALIAVVLPVCVYLLFRVWLNAAMPRGLLPLPL
ncbi:MAG TPA: tripartite tricarboxylate transporter TctB family protein [Burkholderiales bacterium]|nr:tripartite tricarboxylate transporter TctB family protein [Burkholderiales bacterium]